jgi:hypothetical protein
MGFSAECDQMTLENLGRDRYSLPADPLRDELEKLPRIGLRSACLFLATSGIGCISGLSAGA